MKLHVENCAAGAGIVAGVLTGDVAMLGSALGSDTIVEVARGPLIPGFAAVKAAAVRPDPRLAPPCVEAGWGGCGEAQAPLRKTGSSAQGWVAHRGFLARAPASPQMKEGAFGCTISGAGPTIVALCDSAEKGKTIAKAMMKAFKESGKLEVRLGPARGVEGERRGAPATRPCGGRWSDGRSDSGPAGRARARR